MAANLRKTRVWLAEIATEQENVLVGLSGGKDSLTILDLCIQAGFKKIECYALHFVPGMRCFDGPVDAAAKRFGHMLAEKQGTEPKPLKVHKLQHPMAGNMLASGVFRPHIKEAIKGDKRLPRLSMNDVFRVARERSGIELICTGERMDESLQRRGQLHKCAGYNVKERRVFPVWDWSARDVIGYLTARKIPIPSGTGKMNMSGIDLRLETLQWLEDHHPKDLDLVLQAFPYALAQLKRAEFAAKASENG